MSGAGPGSASAGLPAGWRRFALIVTAISLAGAGAIAGARLVGPRRTVQPVPAATVAYAGFPLPGGLAPDFTLVDQFGQPLRLSQLRGREVALAFVDDKCTTTCPLTAQTLRDARTLLPPAQRSSVSLVAVNANPAHVAVSDVWQWSQQQHMLDQWSFLTGSPAQLSAVYSAYAVADEVVQGDVVHDPAIVLIDARGFERERFDTEASARAAIVQGETGGLVNGLSQWLPGGPVSATQPPDGAGAASLESAQGTWVSPSFYRGSAVVMNFWASWCTPCRDEMPAIVQFAAAHPGVDFVFVDTRDSAADATAFLRQIDFPVSRYGDVLLDPQGTIADDEAILGLPATVFLRPDGGIAARHAGRVDAQDLAAEVQHLTQ